MIHVKLFGVLRLKTGLKEINMEADTLPEVFRLLSEKTGWSEKDFHNCIVMINGIPAKKKTALKDGDSLVLLSPSGGG